MVLVIPICAALTLAQVIYLNLNPVDPLMVGSSSVAAVAAIGVGASAIIAHAVHALLGQARRPFNIDTLRTFDNSPNSLNHYIHPQLSCCNPDTPNNTTQSHNVTALVIDLRQPAYVHPTPSVLSTSEWRVHAKPTVDLDTRRPSSSRIPRPGYMGNSGSSLLQQPVRNVSVSLERRPAEVSLPATRTAPGPETRVLESVNAIDWRVGCLFGLIVGLACGIPIGSTVAQRRFAEHESRPMSSTPLPPYWIVHTIDESAVLAAVKQYSSVLSAVLDSIPVYSAESGALIVESKPVSETGDSTIDDLVTETVPVTAVTATVATVTATATSEDLLPVTDVGLTTDAIDSASVPLPEDELEDILGDAETVGTVEDPTLVPLPEDDFSASDEDQASLFNCGVDLGSNMSLCTIVGGIGFDMALEDHAGNVAGDFQPANWIISALKVVTAGIKESSEEIGAPNVEMRPAKRRRLLGPEEELGLVKDTGSGLSSVTIDAYPASELTCHSGTGADMVEDIRRQPSGNNWESRGSYFDFSDSESEGADEEQAGPDTAYWLPIPPSLPDARTLQFLAPSMRARYSRLEVIEELVEEEEPLPVSTEPSAVLVDYYADLDDSLLSADMSLDSDPGYPTLELAESESTGGESQFSPAPRLLAPSKSCPGSLAHHIADAGLEHVIKRAMPPMVPSFSSPSLLAYSVELPRRALGVSTRARSSSYPGSLSSLAAGSLSTGQPGGTERAEQEQQVVDEPTKGEAKKKRRRSRASQARQTKRAMAYEIKRAGRRANE